MSKLKLLVVAAMALSPALHNLEGPTAKIGGSVCRGWEGVPLPKSQGELQETYKVMGDDFSKFLVGVAWGMGCGAVGGRIAMHRWGVYIAGVCTGQMGGLLRIMRASAPPGYTSTSIYCGCIHKSKQAPWIL